MQEYRYPSAHAQFEREVTAERIRDKIAASKAKGMWMGGTPPIGYRPDGRSLAVVESDATIVRDVFERYVALGNVRLLQEELARAGITKPARSRISGRQFGGTPFNRAELYRLLGNPVYVGGIRHGKKVHPGLHAAIIDRPTWDKVQRLLADHVKGERGPRAPSEKSLLAGLVSDSDGCLLVASHACKGPRRYRYYVSRSLQDGTSKEGLRVPASELEPLVIEAIARLFERPFEHPAFSDSVLAHVSLVGELSQTLRGRKNDCCRLLVRELIAAVEIRDDRIILKLRRSAMEQAMGAKHAARSEEVLAIDLPGRIVRRGRMVRLIDGGRRASGPKVDRVLVRLIAKGRHWWQRLLTEPRLTVSAIAAGEGLTPSYVTRVIRLAFLSPDVLEAILDGRQPAFVDGVAITASNAISQDWREQRRVLLA